MMKICVITNLYPPFARGGAEKVVQETVQALKQEHEVIVITTKPYKGLSSFKPEMTEEDGVKVYRFYPKNIFFYPNDVKKSALTRLLWHGIDMFSRSSAKKVKKILQSEKPDVVHTHNLKGIGYAIPKVIRKLGLKHVHTVHDVQLITPSGLWIKEKENNFTERLFLRKWYEKINRRKFDSPQMVIFPSNWLRETYSSRGFFSNSKKEVIHNPVKISDHPLSNSLPSREREPLQFLYLGQLEPHKGVKFLVELLQKSKLNNWELNIVGAGSQQEELKKLTAGDSRFVYHGRVQSSGIKDFFARADVLIVPSLCYENAPTVILESLSYRTPVIASRIGGIPEFVKEGENGFLFTAGDQADFARALKEFTDKKETLRPSGTFPIKDHIQKLTQLYFET